MLPSPLLDLDLLPPPRGLDVGGTPLPGQSEMRGGAGDRERAEGEGEQVETRQGAAVCRVGFGRPWRGGGGEGEEDEKGLLARALREAEAREGDRARG